MENADPYDEAAPSVVVGPPRCDFAQQCEGGATTECRVSVSARTQCPVLEAVFGAFHGESHEQLCLERDEQAVIQEVRSEFTETRASSSEVAQQMASSSKMASSSCGHFEDAAYAITTVAATSVQTCYKGARDRAMEDISAFRAELEDCSQLCVAVLTVAGALDRAGYRSASSYIAELRLRHFEFDFSIPVTSPLMSCPCWRSHSQAPGRDSKIRSGGFKTDTPWDFPEDSEHNWWKSQKKPGHVSPDAAYIAPASGVIADLAPVDRVHRASTSHFPRVTGSISGTPLQLQWQNTSRQRLPYHVWHQTQLMYAAPASGKEYIAQEPVVVMELAPMDEYTTPAPAISCVAPASFGVRGASVSGRVHHAKASRDRGSCASGRVHRANASHFMRGASVSGGVHRAKASRDRGACASGRVHRISASQLMRGTGQS